MRTLKMIPLAIALAASMGGDAASGPQYPERPANLDFERGDFGWKFGSDAWSIDEKGGRNGSKCLAWARSASSGDSYATQRFMVEGGGKYRFGGWVKCESLMLGDKPAKPRMTIDWYGEDGRWISGAEGFPVAENGVGNDGWVRFEGSTPPLQGQARIGQFRFTQPSEPITGRFKVDDLEVELVGSSPVEWLVSSAYRDWAEEGEVRFHAILHINCVKNPLETLDAVFVYTDASGCGAERTADAFDAETADVTLRVADLAEGSHPVALEIRKRSGGLLGSTSLSFTRAPRPRRRVDLDDAGRVLLDGKRFFPIGIYATLAPASLEMITNSPFNSIVAYQLPTLAQLDAIAAAGRLLCYNLQRKEAELDQIVNAVKGHPAILAWYVNDEAPADAVPGLRDMRRRLHALDPDHPVWGVTDKPYLVRPFLGTCDVIGLDPYPIGNRRNDIGLASDWPLEARAASFGTLPQWQVPQTFNWKWYRKGETNPEFRFPTKEELACMTYQGIAAGANGLFDFCLSADPATERGREFAANWGNVCDVAAEVKSKADLILSDPGPAVASAPKEVVVRTWRTDSGEVKALVVNRTRQPARGEVRLADGAAFAFDLAPLGYGFVGKVQKNRGHVALAVGDVL